MHRVAILTNVIPSYREDFYKRIFEGSKYSVTVFCNKNKKLEGYKRIESKFNNNVKVFNFLSFKKNIAVWQFFPFMTLLNNYSVYIVDGNPRHISQMLYASIFRLFKRKVIVWSVAYSRNNNPILGRIRLNWWKIFNFFLVYNQLDRENLIKEGFSNKTIVPIQNGLDQNRIDLEIYKWNQERIAKFKCNNNLSGNTILSIGRVINKKYDLMILALKNIVTYVPDIKWVLIGDGDDLNKLNRKVEKEGLSKNVIFLGAVYSEADIAPWFLSSKAMIHPAPIGLSLLHAFGYGLPVVTTDSVKYQGPEFCAFQNGLTGELYHDLDFYSLGKAILKVLNKTYDRNYIKNIPRKCYNTEIMANQFESLLDSIL